MKHKDDCGDPNCLIHGSEENFENLQVVIANVAQAIFALSVIRELDPSDLCHASSDAILGSCKHYRDNDLMKMGLLKDKLNKSKNGKIRLAEYHAKTPAHKSGLVFRVKTQLFIEEGVPEGELLQ